MYVVSYFLPVGIVSNVFSNDPMQVIFPFQFVGLAVFALFTDFSLLVLLSLLPTLIMNLEFISIFLLNRFLKWLPYFAIISAICFLIDTKGPSFINWRMIFEPAFILWVHSMVNISMFIHDVEKYNENNNLYSTK